MILFLQLLTLIFLTNCFFIGHTIHLVFNALIVFILISCLIFSFSDFIALIILLVYSGGLAILFLFSSFSLDLQQADFNKKQPHYLASFLFIYLYKLFTYTKVVTFFIYFFNILNINFFANNTFILAQLLYVNYPVLVFLISLILLVALLGSVSCLTFIEKKLKKTSIFY